MREAKRKKRQEWEAKRREGIGRRQRVVEGEGRGRCRNEGKKGGRGGWKMGGSRKEKGEEERREVEGRKKGGGGPSLFFFSTTFRFNHKFPLYINNSLRLSCPASSQVSTPRIRAALEIGSGN